MLEPGSHAPEFDLPLASQAGRRLVLREVLAKGPALVVFFKTECPTCKLAFPILERLAGLARAEGIAASLVAIGQNHPSEIPSFAKTYGATFPIATEEAPYDISNAYDVTNVPSIFLIEEHGVIVRSVVGFSRNEYDGLAAWLRSRGQGDLAFASLFTEADAGLPALQPG